MGSEMCISDSDHAGAPDAGLHVVAGKIAQLLRDDPGSAVHVEIKLWVLVEITADRGQRGVQIGDAVEDGHGAVAYTHLTLPTKRVV